MAGLSTQTLSQTTPQSDVPGSTLLMLVMSLNETTETADETVEQVHHLLDTNQVRLTGNFRGTRLRDDALSAGGPARVRQ